MARSCGPEAMQFQLLVLRRIKSQAYVKNQEQLDSLGDDEKGGMHALNRKKLFSARIAGVKEVLLNK